MSSGEFHTVFGSLRQFTRGEIEIVNDEPRNYAFSNVFDVAARSAPYEKIVVGKSLQYVIETLRAEGESDWFAAPHDEFALVMDGTIKIELVKLEGRPPRRRGAQAGSVRLPQDPAGEPMGFMRLGRGHQALLPQGAAYRFAAERGVGVILLQTLLGPHSVQKWSEICLT